jgi:hypothetical protein
MVLRYIGSIQRAHRVRTDEPLNELWQAWSKLSDDHYLKAHWTGSNDEQRLTVSTIIRQAQEYRAASKQTSLLTRPVLVYYSALNLAKAAIWLRTDAAPPQHHGLMRPDPADEILDLAAKVNNGVFRSLADMLGRKTTIGDRFTLRDFVANLVELRDKITDYFAIAPGVVPVAPDIFMDGTIRLIIDPRSLGVESLEEAATLVKERTTLFDDFNQIRFEKLSLATANLRRRARNWLRGISA